MWGRILRASLILAICLVAACVSASPLGEQIQKELDDSPFLVAQQLKMRVVEESKGSVTVELTEGPAKLRDLFFRGYVIEGSALAEANFKEDVAKAIRVIKQTLITIKGIEGVKEILLTAVPPSSAAPSETFSGQPNQQGENSPLGGHIQKELDASPFLVSQKLKMRILDEREGKVSLELTEGPQKIRDLLRRGNEINGSALAETNLEAAEVKALRSIKRTLNVIKGLEGVKEISLTGALSSSAVPAETSNQSAQKEATGFLESQIQKELDASPFLASQQLKMRVLDEKQGSVTLELTEGPQKLRDLFRRGYEINGSALAEVNLEADEVKALRSVKRTLNSLKSLEGIKEISLTGALSPSVTSAETLSSQPGSQVEPSTLEEQIQKELDSFLFLAEQKVKMRVLHEHDGVVSLEVTEGPKKLRDLLRRGYEINGNGLAETNLNPEIIKALRSVRRAWKIIKEFKGVKEVALTGAVDADKDRAENLYEEAMQKMNQNNMVIGREVFNLLTKSAQLGFLRAQTDLAQIYAQGMDLMPDEEKAVFWFRKAADQGDAASQYQLAMRCLQGQSEDRDYSGALAWFKKAAGKDANPEIRARSLVALATLLATCPVAELRDGNAAVEYAKTALEVAPKGGAMDALAAAYARCGRFEEAIEQEKKWVKQIEDSKALPQDVKENMLFNAKYKLQLYLKSQPYTVLQ